jgi:hypothetical protein
MPNFVMLWVILQNVVMLWVIMPNVVMLSVIMPNLVMLWVIILSECDAVTGCHYAESCYAMGHYTECM